MITRACLLSVAAVLAVGPLPAGEPPAGAIAMIRDLRLSILARRELHNDPMLRGYQLGVEVKAGVARVWGSVPERDLARRALSRVEHLDGVRDVVSELKTAGPIMIGTDDGFKALKGPSPPPDLKPVPPAAQPVKRDGLADRVRRVQQEGGRFARVRVEVSGRVVTVYRGADDETAGALALRLRDLEGVDEVRLER
ncbi:MAG: BON domain-containing protein [Gemmataceae bacterium]